MTERWSRSDDLIETLDDVGELLRGCPGYPPTAYEIPSDSGLLRIARKSLVPKCKVEVPPERGKWAKTRTSGALFSPTWECAGLASDASCRSPVGHLPWRSVLGAIWKAQ